MTSTVGNGEVSVAEVAGGLAGVLGAPSSGDAVLEAQAVPCCLAAQTVDVDNLSGVDVDVAGSQSASSEIVNVSACSSPPVPVARPETSRRRTRDKQAGPAVADTPRSSVTTAQADLLPKRHRLLLTLRSHTLQKLQELCVSRGLDQEGEKDVLVQRLTDL